MLAAPDRATRWPAAKRSHSPSCCGSQGTSYTSTSRSLARALDRDGEHARPSVASTWSVNAVAWRGLSCRRASLAWPRRGEVPVSVPVRGDPGGEDSSRAAPALEGVPGPGLITEIPPPFPGCGDKPRPNRTRVVLPHLHASADAPVTADTGAYDPAAPNLGWASETGISYCASALNSDDILVLLARDSDEAVGTWSPAFAVPHTGSRPGKHSCLCWPSKSRCRRAANDSISQLGREERRPQSFGHRLCRQPRRPALLCSSRLCREFCHS